MDRFNDFFGVHDFEAPEIGAFQQPHDLPSLLEYLQIIVDSSYDAVDRVNYHQPPMYAIEQRHRRTKRYLRHLSTMIWSFEQFEFGERDSPWIGTMLLGLLLLIEHQINLMDSYRRHARERAGLHGL
ncbi:hypothetical protein O181_087099 [Austropuccinia psidii MF-1]|uniref:Uncharacterized protein n=1 Tax=Austropuccinia psidii MF-1 TaxID=1389203 RepID=A0A9Q3P0Z4_9BASI|nr:hypothetical protein [Austropuccinia psidii MF-1]